MLSRESFKECSSEAILKNDQTFTFQGDLYENSMAVLNAFIRELFKTRLKVQNISIYEKPAKAVLRLGGSERLRSETVWSKALKKAKLRKRNEITYMTVVVSRKENSKNPFFLNCQVQQFYQ